MSPFILLLLLLIIVVCVFGYTTYRSNVDKRAKEKKKNIYNDRV